MCISFGVIVLSFFDFSPLLNEAILAVIGTFFFTLTCGYAFGMPYAKKVIMKRLQFGLNRLINLIPEFYRPLLKHFDKLSLGTLTRMIRERGSSTVSLLSDVFLKHVRRLNYDFLYKDEKWRSKRVGNFVYELTEYDFKSKRKVDAEDPAKGFYEICG